MNFKYGFSLRRRCPTSYHFIKSWTTWWIDWFMTELRPKFPILDFNDSSSLTSCRYLQIEVDIMSKMSSNGVATTYLLASLPSPGLKRKPFFSCRTVSEKPCVWGTITGIPHAKASKTVFPNVSNSDADTCMSLDA